MTLRTAAIIGSVIFMAWCIGHMSDPSSVSTDPVAPLATPVLDQHSAPAMTDSERRVRDNLEQAAAAAAVLDATDEICKGEHARAKKLARAHTNWDPRAVGLVACRRVSVGMTDEQMRASWGAPDEINTTQSAYSHHEQWVYGTGNYVYLDDGVVSSYQTTGH